MKCANCHKDGAYVYSLTAKKQVIFCSAHLPSFLEPARKAGLLKTTEAYKAALKDGLNSLIKAPEVVPEIVEVAVEEAVEDTSEDTIEEVTEEPTEEDSTAPKKRVVKKKAE